MTDYTEDIEKDGHPGRKPGEKEETPGCNQTPLPMFPELANQIREKAFYHIHSPRQTYKRNTSNLSDPASDMAVVLIEKAQIAAMMHRMGFARLEIIQDLVERHTVEELRSFI